MAISAGALERLVEEVAPITGRGKAVLFSAVVLLASGSLVGGSPGALLVTSGIGLALLVLLERQVFLSRLAVAEKLEIKYIIGRPLVEGEKRRVVIEIRNSYPVPIEHLEYYDYPPPILRVEGKPVAALYVPARGGVILEYGVTLVLGRHRWGAARLVVEDPLGFFRKDLARATGFSVTVQPRPLEITRRSVALPAIVQPGGVTRMRRRGVGTEFLELREYIPGDELRFVDWKAFARTGKLMVKVFEQESFLRAVVVLDATPTMFRGVIGETKIEYAARLVVALAEYFARKGDFYRVYIVTRGDARVYSTPWLRGRTSSSVVKSFLAEHIDWPVSEEEAGILGELRAERLSRALVSSLPRGRTLVFLVTDFGERKYLAKKYAESLERLVAMYNTLYTLLPVTTFFELQVLSGIAAALYRVLEYNRIKYYGSMVRELRASGINAVATGPRDLLSYVLARLEHIRGVTA